ncbi:uncharacterized, partial [Tachysurus ichikawai]
DKTPDNSMSMSSCFHSEFYLYFWLDATTAISRPSTRSYFCHDGVSKVPMVQEGSHFGYYNYNPEVHKGESYLHLNIYDYHLEKLLHMLDSTSAPKSIILALQTLQTPAAIWILPCLLRLCLRSCDLQLTTLVGSYLHLRSCKLLPTCGSFCNSYAFQSERTA